MHLKNRTNDYAEIFGGLYDATPKAVFAALAFSLAARLEGTGDYDTAIDLLWKEWGSLHRAGIVPQKPMQLKGGSRDN